MIPRPLLAALCVAACRTQTPAVDAATPDARPDVVDATPDVDEAPDAAVADVPADLLTATCGASSPAALMACVRREDLTRDVTEVASPRAPGSAHHDAVRDLCATRLAALGFTVERHAYGTGTNVIGVRPGDRKSVV